MVSAQLLEKRDEKDVTYHHSARPLREMLGEENACRSL